MPDVVIVDSGVANLASIASALQRLGASVAVTTDAAEVRAALRVVLPGVGAFGAGVAALRAHALDRAVTEAVDRASPVLAICLGMQLLCAASEETPGVAGLGVIGGTCRRLSSEVRVPHLGWNVVTPEALGTQGRVVGAGVAAFANSYGLQDAPPGWTPSWTTHGAPFVAALERERIVACQFHPELSGAYGAALLERWLSGRRTDTTPAPASVTSAGLFPRVVPCLDVKDGRVVKGVRFQELRDAGDPATLGARYEAEGADELVVLDVGASPEGRATQLDTVARVRAAIGIPLTVGGGVRSVADARRLLAAGADKVGVNTAAVGRPALLTELSEAFGSQCVVLAIDARRAGGGWEALTYGGRHPARSDAVAWAQEGTALGAGEILLTSWDRDGTRAGPDCDLLRVVLAAVPVPVIASGGIGTRAHVAAAFQAGAGAVLAASVFHDGDDTITGVKADLTARGIRVRP